MFEKKLGEGLGVKTKALLREFANKKRMTLPQYYAALDKYNAEVDRLHSEERKEKERTRKLNIRAEQKKKREQEKTDLKYTSKIIMDYKISDRPNEVDEWFNTIIKPVLIKGCEKLVGKKMVYIQTSYDGKIYKNGIMDITSKNFLTIYWNNLSSYIESYIDGEIFNIFDKFSNYARVVIFDTEEIIPERIQQKYLDGEKHCVIEPLRLTFTEYAKNSESIASKKKMEQIVRRLNELEKVYIDGVPEDDMEIIGKAVSRCIIIHNIIGGEIKRYNKSSSKYFHFTNTRKNHIDSGYITIGGEYNKITNDEMMSLLEEHNRDKLFYIFDGNIENNEVRSLSSSRGNWKVVNEDYAIYKEFDKTIGKQHYGLNAVEYKELNEYIKEARIINATPVPLCENPNDLTHYVHHIDIAKAYTQHRHSEYYKGFLGHIHNYAKLDHIRNTDDVLKFVDEHIGIYQVKIITMDISENHPYSKYIIKGKGNKSKLLHQLGIFENNVYTLTSVEIVAFIKEYGVKMSLVSGCWGKSFDFEYTDDMLENRRYAIWAGKLGQDKEYQRYSFTGDKEWASHLKSELGNDKVYYFDNMNMITIKLNKTAYFTYHHIFAFITAYTRLNMLSVMNKIEGSLIKVIMDGIYYRGEVQDITIPHHKDKELKKHISFRDHWYYPTTINTSHWGKIDFMDNCILAGAGGTGKTYSVYNSKSIIKPLYVVPSHILGKKMQEEYGCLYTTIQRLVGDGCISYKDMFRAPHTILIDELTMINRSLIEKAIEMYPTSLLLIAGDIDKNQWYQCRNGSDGVFTELFMPQDWKYKFYMEDRRSKDNDIKLLKENIRNEMKKIFETGGRCEAEILNDYIKNNYKVLSFNDAVAKFNTGDIWISGTHKTNKRLLDNGIVSGYINVKKEINMNCEGEKRGAFTIHSYQGLTIQKENVFISLDNFEYAMLYTAVSRCCNFNQITFVL